MPLAPRKYGPLQNFKSLSSLCSKRNVKKPLLQKKWFSEPLIKGFQFVSSQNSTVFWDGHVPINWLISPLSTKANAFFLEVDGGMITLGISSSFLTNLDFYTLEDFTEVATITLKSCPSSLGGGAFPLPSLSIIPTIRARVWLWFQSRAHIFPYSIAYWT